jgi:hypothetical protein
MPFPSSKASVEKHLLITFLAWCVILMFAGLFSPPLDSHIQPPPLTKWSIATVAALPSLYMAILIPAYFYQSWKMLPTVPNKISYGLWLSVESLAFLVILTLLWFGVR